ncbi:unnamed protein product [Candida verbasci]|uniref:Cytochrome b5 heme-binding domain-containing protein n=1 Tax=Candida verbasci TaxID=1227364 RepID=A0A9W4TUD8_9ASCO|nr:unnamed protein product [Candida verbasci]
MFGDNNGEPTEIYKYNESLELHSLPIFTRSQLSNYNGETRDEIYVGIKGYIYDVTSNAQSYGYGKPYHVFVGKEATRLLGLNKLKIDDLDGKDTWDYSDLGDKQLAIIDDWIKFFKNRYKIVGIIVDHEGE